MINCLLSRIESEVFSRISTGGEKPPRPPALNQNSMSFLNHLLEMSLTEEVTKTFSILFRLYSRPRYRLETTGGYIISKLVRVIHTGITDPIPQLAKLSLSFGMLLIVIFNYFNALLHGFFLVKLGSITPPSIKLMKLYSTAPPLLSSQSHSAAPSTVAQSS